MCKLCAFAARYPRVRQDSLVFDLSQFAVAIEVRPVSKQSSGRSSGQSSERSPKQTFTTTQEKSP
jgi:hypothetical protein